PADARRAGLGWRRWRDRRDADIHGGWQYAGFHARGVDPAKDGQDDRARGWRRQRAGGQDLQQHDFRRVDDCRERGFRARGETRTRSPEAVRHLVEIVGPVLVDDDILSGAWARADVARKSRLSGGIYRCDDA